MSDLSESTTDAAQLHRRLQLQEAELQDLKERVRLQDEMIDVLAAALANLCADPRGAAPEAAARIRDLLFDRGKLSDRAQPL